jgi:hypothetical protein
MQQDAAVASLPAPPELRCPYCHEPAGEVLLACELCGSVLHEACAAEHGRCTSLGCPGKLRAPGPAGLLDRRAVHVEPPPPRLSAELLRIPLGPLAFVAILFTAAAALGSHLHAVLP